MSHPVSAAELASPAYVAMQKQLHASPRGYGGRGDKWAGVVLQLAVAYSAESILDYGCGQGSLAKALRLYPTFAPIHEYDPAIPGKDALPEPADLVVCTDVLEHIERERLAAVLAHLKSLARKAIWAVISTKTSNKKLSDGRNAHIIVQPAKWWKTRLIEAGFTPKPPPTTVRVCPEKEWSAVLL